jgi:hypothetical protein
MDPKRQALREVSGRARCVVPDRLGDYHAKRGCMERGQSCVGMVGKLRLGLEVAPFSEIVSRWRCSESSSAGRVYRREGRVENEGRMGGFVCARGCEMMRKASTARAGHLWDESGLAE